MNKYDWKKKIKRICLDAGVYEPSSDSVMDMLAETMSTWQDWCADYNVAKKKNDIEMKNTCTIRKNDCVKTAKGLWADLCLTTKEYRDFMAKNGESKKENKLISLLLEDRNAESE